MSSDKPNFLSQPVVKNVFIFRNGDPYYQARRIVINQKRISNFETLLREVTSGIQAPFGAVRNIYTPTGGHKVDCLESLKSGEQYVAAGREKFKKMDYHQIGSRRKRMMHTQVKPLQQNHRIIVSARFLKPIKEPCPIFVVANGDILDPATRLLIHQKMLGQFDRILEMVTEKMGLKVLGGVRSLYTFEGHQVTDGNRLESGQLYVAVGREKFKKLPYNDLLFSKPKGARKANGMKAHTLPPIYRFSKQNGNSKSVVRSSNSGDTDSKNSSPHQNGSSKEHLSSIVRDISQARLISLRKKRSRQSMTLSISDNADLESKPDDEITEDKTSQDQMTEEKTDDDTHAEEGNSEKASKEEKTSSKNMTEGGMSVSKEEKEENQETNFVKERWKRQEENDEQSYEKDIQTTIRSEEKKEEVAEKVKEEETDESEEEVKRQEQGSREKAKEAEVVKEEVTGEHKKGLQEQEQESEEKEEELKEVKEEVINESQKEVKNHELWSRSSNSDKTQDSKDKEDGSHPSSEHEKDEQDKNTEEEKGDKRRGKGQKNNQDQVNDEGEGKKQKVMENSNDPGKTQSDNETRENDSRSSSSNSNQEEDVSQTKEGHTKEAGENERKINREVIARDDEVEGKADIDM